MRRHLPRAATVLGAGLLAGAACGQATHPAPPDLRVLFIGNSLTYQNDLPGTFAAVAASGGIRVGVASVALPNYALIDHTGTNSSAMTAIRRGRWSFVVLQQGPTWPGVCLDTLVLAAQRFDGAIRTAGARPALLMTWPSVTDSVYFEGVHVSYAAAAQAVDGLFIPAGDAWRAAWHADPALPLYGGDGYHPAPLGTLLAAFTIYERITGRDARTLPAEAKVGGVLLAVPPATIRLLQQAAHDASAAAAAESPSPATRRSTAGVQSTGTC